MSVIGKAGKSVSLSLLRAAWSWAHQKPVQASRRFEAYETMRAFLLDEVPEPVDRDYASDEDLHTKAVMHLVDTEVLL